MYDPVAAATYGNASAYNSSFLSYCYVRFLVLKSDGSPLQNATVYLDNGEYTTGADGKTDWIHVYADTWEITIAKDGYTTTVMPFVIDRWREDIEIMLLASQGSGRSFAITGGNTGDERYLTTTGQLEVCGNRNFEMGGVGAGNDNRPMTVLGTNTRRWFNKGTQRWYHKIRREYCDT